jgi:hypothetical protein
VTIVIFAPAVPRRAAAQDIAWPEAIRQCWNDAAANSSLRCLYTEGKLRGTKSGKDCLVEAVKAARQNDHGGALHWILACQCGVGSAQVKQALRDHQNDAVRLVVDTYGPFVQ